MQLAQTRVDITINNLLAISNTRLLGHYCDVDPRLRQMAVFVKHWAKTRGVNDAYRCGDAAPTWLVFLFLRLVFNGRGHVRMAG